MLSCYSETAILRAAQGAARSSRRCDPLHRWRNWAIRGRGTLDLARAICLNGIACSRQPFARSKQDGGVEGGQGERPARWSFAHSWFDRGYGGGLKPERGRSLSGFRVKPGMTDSRRRPRRYDLRHRSQRPRLLAQRPRRDKSGATSSADTRCSRSGSPTASATSSAARSTPRKSSTSPIRLGGLQRSCWRPVGMRPKSRRRLSSIAQVHQVRYTAAAVVDLKRIPAVCFRSRTGAEPVRDWLRSLDKQDRFRIGTDVKTVEFGWPVGMPTCTMHLGTAFTRCGRPSATGLLGSCSASVTDT